MVGSLETPDVVASLAENVFSSALLSTTHPHYPYSDPKRLTGKYLKSTDLSSVYIENACGGSPAVPQMLFIVLCQMFFMDRCQDFIYSTIDGNE